MAAIFTVSPSPFSQSTQLVTVTVKDTVNFVDGGNATIEVSEKNSAANKITVAISHDGVAGSQTYRGTFTVLHESGGTSDDATDKLAVGTGDIVVIKYTDASSTVSTTEVNYTYDPATGVNLEVSPSVAWGKDKAITIKVKDPSKGASDNLTVTIREEGSNPVNQTTVTLTYDTSLGLHKGVAYLTNDSASTVSPKLVLTRNATVQFTYLSKVAAVTYTLEQPKEKGFYVEVRSSVRNLHWDLVTILTKAGWKFVETIPPTVDSNGFVTSFKHVLKTTTTPKEVDGKAMSVDMFLLIEHKNYPGNNSGNFKEITFKLSPNYYYHDKAVLGSAPDSQLSDVLYQNGDLYKVLEYPTYPVEVMFVPLAISSNTPFVLDIPVNIWGFASNDFFSFVLQGEPSLTSDGFGQVSHIYAGAIESFKEGKVDIGGNFALAGSAFIGTPGGQRYGTNTSDGVSSIAMYRTYGGLLWQKHFASIIQDDPQGDNKKSELYQPSSWTGKFHLSPLYVYHPTDGKRGFFKNTLVVQKQGILHLDELEIIRPVDECNPCPVDGSGNKIDPNDTDHPMYEQVWKREKYKYYRLTNIQHPLKSFNVNDEFAGIGIAIKMDATNVIKFNTSYDIVTGNGVSSWTGTGAVPEGAQLAGARTAPISNGNVKLSTGGQSFIQPDLTGTVSKLQVVNNNTTGKPEAATVEFLVNENPNGADQLDTTASAQTGTGTPRTINFTMYRAYDLDANGKYGYRGQFYLTQATGGTNDDSNVLEVQTGDKLTVTYKALTKQITV